ncbi:MAG: PmoA family protein [Acidimicrobiia bacterium]|nr:PmoA family protein [Acidimicrobiia bacterium]
MDLPCTWDAPRPYVHPLTSPAGAVLSVEAPGDHPWHHALWFTIKFVNGENFWEEYGEFGTLRTTQVDETPVADNSVTATIEWVAPDGESIRLHETRSIRTEPIDADSYLIDWSESLTVPVATELDRTPFTTWGGYGGLTLRGAPTWTDTVIRLADGTDRDRCLGDPSPWLSIEGTATEWTDKPNVRADKPSRSEARAEASSEAVSPPRDASTEMANERADGQEAVSPPQHASTEMANVRAGRPAGAIVFDHPDNLRSPTPWYASTRADTYGDGWANFVNAAFLWNEALSLAADATLDLAYRVIVHDGHWESDRIRAEYDRWIR